MLLYQAYRDSVAARRLVTKQSGNKNCRPGSTNLHLLPAGQALSRLGSFLVSSIETTLGVGCQVFFDPGEWPP
jgi:hypothetical protein